MSRRFTHGGRIDTRDRGPFVTGTLTAGEAVDRLLAAWPQSDTWPRMRGEAYGPQYLNPADTVERVLYAVTCTPAVEVLFTREDYGLLVLHHPMRPADPAPHVVLHTPFDCGVGGLNDLWRDALGIQDARHIVDNLGWYGPLREPVSTQELVERVRAFAGGIDGQLLTRTDRIETVAVCAGLGGWIAQEAGATGADAFITGELTQPASRLGCPVVIEMGHTRSERIGVDAIQRVLGPAVQVDVAPLGVDQFGREVFGVTGDITP